MRRQIGHLLQVKVLETHVALSIIRHRIGAFFSITTVQVLCDVRVNRGLLVENLQQVVRMYLSLCHIMLAVSTAPLRSDLFFSSQKHGAMCHHSAFAEAII